MTDIRGAVLTAPLFIWLLLMAGGCVKDTPLEESLQPGDMLPAFSVTLSDGSVVDTESVLGKVTLIELFNTDCPDCRKSLPELQRVWEWFAANSDVCVMAIARDEVAASVDAYWEANGLTVPVSPQEGTAVYSLFASEGIPRIYVADKSGMIMRVYGPYDSPSAETLITDVMSFL